MADTVNTTLDPQLNRRGFLKGITMAAAALGMSDAVIPKMVEAAASGERPRVIWLHFQECTGCTESLLRSSHPDLARLILDIISLDYHETVMAAAGHQAEHNLHDTVQNHPFILVVEGAIPTKENGIHCMIAGKTAMEILAEVAPKASAIIAIGTCATYGGVQAGLLEKGLSWIALFIALAPMLGFMGTVIGMIAAFDKIQLAGDVQASLVAGGIKVALITTVSGLIVAIILQIFYNYLVAQIDSIVNKMEDASISLVDLLVKHNAKK